MTKFKSDAALFLLFSLLLLCCSVSAPEEDWDVEFPAGDVKVATDLFVHGGSGESYFFQTNDPEKALPHGKSFWLPRGKAQSPFVSYKVECTKTGGDLYAGYGLIVCHGSEFGQESMLSALIRLDGYYQCAEVIGSDYQPFSQWTYSTAIHRGYGKTNTLELSLDERSVFHLIINGFEVFHFEDSQLPLHREGVSGFLVVTSPEEDFPSFPVKVRFREL